MTPTETLTAPVVFHCWDYSTADARRHYQSMHLTRESGDQLVMILPQYAALLWAAAGWGDWTPPPTTAPPTSFHRMFAQDAVPGHWWPCGQMMSGGGAYGLAAGFRRALARFANRDNEYLPPAVPATNLLQDRYDSAMSVSAATFDALHLARHADKIFAFLDGGACRIMAGLPEALAALDRPDPSAAKRHELQASRDRLIVAISHGTVTEAEAGPQLASLRDALARLDTPAGPTTT